MEANEVISSLAQKQPGVILLTLPDIKRHSSTHPIHLPCQASVILFLRSIFPPWLPNQNLILFGAAVSSSNAQFLTPLLLAEMYWKSLNGTCWKAFRKE